MTISRRNITVTALLGISLITSTVLAGPYLQFVFGNVNQSHELMRFGSINSVDNVVRLGTVTSRGHSDGLDFDGGPIIGSRWGQVRFNQGLPLYFTTHAGWRTGLYKWRNNKSNRYDNINMYPFGWRPGLRQATVFGYEAPTCVGIRGNGPRLWAHFASLARVTEEFGPIGGAAGGSSGSISVFVTESIHANPLVTRCGAGQMCSLEEATARMALLFKSVEGLNNAGLIDDVLALTELIGQIQAGGIEDLLNGDNPLQGVEALISIVQDPDLQQIINPELVSLLINSPDPEFHATDVVQGLQGALTFQVNDPSPLVRPGPINFTAFTNIVGRLGNFYAGYGPFERSKTQQFMQHCATPGLGLDWPAVRDLPAPGGTCGSMFSDLFDTYLDNYDPDSGPNRLNDRIGNYLRSFVATSVLEGDAIDTFAQAKTDYFAAQPFSLDVSFDDVKFGYWGRRDDLERVSQNIGQFDDPKSAKFTTLGSPQWRDILSVSPAEPGLSRALELPDGRVSAGGWSDPVPSQVLSAAGCERVILINRQDGIGSFTTGVAEQLGASQADLEAQYSLTDLNSGFSRSLADAAGVWCTNWDAPDTLDIAGLAAEGWNAPLETSDPDLLVFENAGSNLGIAGCSLGVPSRQGLGSGKR